MYTRSIDNSYIPLKTNLYVHMYYVLTNIRCDFVRFSTLDQSDTTQTPPILYMYLIFFLNLFMDFFISIMHLVKLKVSKIFL